MVKEKVLCIVMLTVLSACAAPADRPDHENAKTQIKKLINDDDKFYTITKLEYTNGFQKDANNYIVLVTYIRTFEVSSSVYVKAKSSNT